MSDADRTMLRELEREWDNAGLRRHTSAAEMTYLASGLDVLKDRGVAGGVLECGMGFSTAALSRLCGQHGRRLWSADSFQGLPEGAELNGYTPGQFKTEREDLEEALEKFGSREWVKLLPGWYEETLPGWKEPLAMIWLDVDLGASVKTVLRHCLPRLSPGGLIFCHESRPDYLDVLGQPDPARVNAVWRAVRRGLSGYRYRCQYLWECTGVIEPLHRTKFVWVVGSPRSGTTFLARLIGRSTDRCYMEPREFERHQVGDWVFPSSGSVTFKFCENGHVADKILVRFPNSYFVHVVRDPRNVLHSMVRPKADAVPRRPFPELGDDEAQRVRLAFDRWREITASAKAIADLNQRRYIEVRYEELPAELDRLEAFLGLRLDRSPVFENRNVPAEELAYLNQYPQAEGLKL